MLLFCMTSCFKEYCFDFSITLSELLTIVGAIVAFLVALNQYMKAQKWKRTEFVLSYYNEVLNSFNVKRGMKMLDWNSIDVPLLDGEIEGKSSFWFTDDLLQSALISHHDVNPEVGFSDEEVVIRFVMDDFFEKLGSFYPFIKTGLVKTNDVSGDIIYWVKIIGDKSNNSKNEATRKRIWNYLNTYNYDNVINLCKLFGYDLKFD